MSTEHVEWRDNKPVLVLDDQTPPGNRRDVLRGDFAMVRYQDRDGRDETYLVLCGLSPVNRKLVYKVGLSTDLDSQMLCLFKTQDSPGMAREGHEE